MTNVDVRAEATARRTAALKDGVPLAQARKAAPNGDAARALPFAAELRAQLVDVGGRQLHQVEGYASITKRAYPMWDFFGEYEELIAGDAFDATLAAKPDVAFLTNHRGITMARTTNGTLELAADQIGLRSTALLNPDRQDVRDLISAVTDGLITEMSFAFMVDDAEWSEDFTQYTIKQVNLDRGDVSAVNYGANPYTSIAARSREVLDDLAHLPAGAVRAALSRLTGRADMPAPKSDPAPGSAPQSDGAGQESLTGRSVTSVAAWLAGAEDRTR